MNVYYIKLIDENKNLSAYNFLALNFDELTKLIKIFNNIDEYEILEINKVTNGYDIDLPWYFANDEHPYGIELDYHDVQDLALL